MEHTCVPNVALREVEVVSDDRQERGSGEARHEASEEGQPREVEGSHVRGAERPELDPSSFALRIDAERESVGIIITITIIIIIMWRGLVPGAIVGFGDSS
jgi:hypothetical protein